MSLRPQSVSMNEKTCMKNVSLHPSEFIETKCSFVYIFFKNDIILNSAPSHLFFSMMFWWKLNLSILFIINVEGISITWMKLIYKDGVYHSLMLEFSAELP